MTGRRQTIRPLEIIAIVGPKGVGKTTVANQLVVGYGFTRFRFADTLKEMLKALGLSSEHIDGPLKEAPLDLLCGHTPRHAMQTLGTEWRDMLDKRLWSNITAQKISDLAERQVGLPGPLRIVVDDMRFSHEVEVLEQFFPGRVTILRVRNKKRREPYIRMWMMRRAWGRVILWLIRRRLHLSEVEWNSLPADVEIDNSGSLEALEAAVRKVADAFDLVHGQDTTQRLRLAAE